MQELLRRASLAATFATLAVFVVAAPAAAQEPEEEEGRSVELQDWERLELQSLVDVVGAALRGELTPTENLFGLTSDFLKGADQNTYVPFAVTVEPDQIGASTVAMYLYVTEHQEPGSAPAVDVDADADAEQPEAVLPRMVFEDAYFIDVAEARAQGGSIHLTRAFTAPGGVYDVYVAIRDSMGGPAEDAEAQPTVLMIREQVEVPDLWTDDLQTSSVLIADLVEPLTEPLSPAEQVQQPYTLGTTRIVPKFDRDFGKQDELSLILLVYNPRLTGEQKPDLTIEYNFHAQTDAGEEFFNKTNPQQFNAQTLPPGFDVALGHQIVAGQSVPLTLFPAGDYRLEITISDNEAGTTLTRDVNFTVLET